MVNGNIYVNGQYRENNPGWHVADSPWKAKQILKIIDRNKLEPLTMCEVGCGAGEIINQLHLNMHQNISFVGYEISSQAFEMCKLRESDRLSFYLKSITEEDDNIRYDIAMAIDVIEHIEDYIGFLRIFRNKGDYKIFHIPLDLSVQAVLRVSPIMGCRERVGHIHYFTKETAIASLRDAGYEIIDYFYTAGGVELPSKSVKSGLAKIPRRLAFLLNGNLAVRILGGYSIMILAR